MLGNLDQLPFNRLERLQNKRIHLLNFQRKYWKQGAKMHHIKFIDKNTKYYHVVAKTIFFKKNTVKFQIKSGFIIQDSALIINEISKKMAERFMLNRSATQANYDN